MKVALWWNMGPPNADALQLLKTNCYRTTPSVASEKNVTNGAESRTVAIRQCLFVDSGWGIALVFRLCRVHGRFHAGPPATLMRAITCPEVSHDPHRIRTRSR